MNTAGGEEAGCCTPFPPPKKKKKKRHSLGVRGIDEMLLVEVPVDTVDLAALRVSDFRDFR